MSTTQSDWNTQIINEFRANNGHVESANFGKSLILLHHIGARTGTRRLNPLRAVHDGHDTWWIVASKQGAPDNPDWCHNLLAHPEVEIETPTHGTVSVTARVLIGSAREHAWQRFTTENPIFLQYQEETDRVFPVFALTRRG